MASGPICHVIESKIARNDMSQRRLSAAARFLNLLHSERHAKGELLCARDESFVYRARLRGGTRKVLHQPCRRLSESLLTSETITSHKHLTSCSRRETRWKICDYDVSSHLSPTMRQRRHLITRLHEAIQFRRSRLMLSRQLKLIWGDRGSCQLRMSTLIRYDDHFSI